MRNPSDILEDAKELLEDPKPIDRSSYAIQPYSILPPDEPLPPPMIETPTDKFETLPADLRDDDLGINFYSAKRKLLATLVEALEQAVARYQSTGSPESGLLVGSISNQVQKTLKDLEKSQDPRVLYDQIDSEIFRMIQEAMVKVVTSEVQRLVTETKKLIPPDKMPPFLEALKLMTKRCGPFFDEQLDEASKRLKVILNIKDKKTMKDIDDATVVPDL